MFLKNIEIQIEETGTKYKFSAVSNGQTIAFGIVETFTFNMLTGVFAAGNMRMSGVKSVKM